MQNFFLQPQTVSAMGGRLFHYPLYPEVTVPAASGNRPGNLPNATIELQTGFHFFSESLFARYTTGDEEADNTSSGLYVQIRDASNNVSLTANYVPVELIAAPGRMARAGLASSPPGNALYIDGFAMPAFFTANGGILFDLVNNDEATQIFGAVVRGWLLPTSIVTDARAFARMVMEHQATAPWVEGMA